VYANRRSRRVNHPAISDTLDGPASARADHGLHAHWRPARAPGPLRTAQAGPKSMSRHGQRESLGIQDSVVEFGVTSFGSSHRRRPATPRRGPPRCGSTGPWLMTPIGKGPPFIRRSRSLDEVAAAPADPPHRRTPGRSGAGAAPGRSTSSLKLLRQAPERPSEGLRTVEADARQCIRVGVGSESAGTSQRTGSSVGVGDDPIQRGRPGHSVAGKPRGGVGTQASGWTRPGPAVVVPEL
jgi:hypothetical protein